MREVQLSPDGKTLVVTIAMRLGRRAGRKLIVAPDGSEVGKMPRARHADETLLRMLAKAWRWQRWLEGGRYRAVRELAAAERVCHSYVSRVLKLTLLAPELVEAILDGRQPRGLTAQELLRELPLTWEEQRRLNATKSV
jgi:hypothetical protein